MNMGVFILEFIMCLFFYILHLKQGGMVRSATARFSKRGKYFFLNHKSNYQGNIFLSGPNNSTYNLKN